MCGLVHAEEKFCWTRLHQDWSQLLREYGMHTQPVRSLLAPLPALDLKTRPSITLVRPPGGPDVTPHVKNTLSWRSK